MKIAINNRGSTRSRSAMTLVEMMGSLSIFVVLVGAYITAYIFIVRQDQMATNLQGPNDASRLNLNMLVNELRSCKNVQIGNGTYTNFTPITNGLQMGREVQLITSTNSGIEIYYWFDTNTWALYRSSFTNNILIDSNVVTQFLTNTTSQWLTNSMTFEAYDYTGTNLLTMNPTNYNYNYTVRVLLEFAAPYQYGLSLATNDPGTMYMLTYSAARRCP